MKKGIQSTAYIGRYEPFEAGVIKAKEHGYDCFDYQDFINTDQSYLFELNNLEFENELKLQKKIMDFHGITVNQTHAPWRYPMHDTELEDRNERFEKMCHSIYGTALLGSKLFVVHNIMPDYKDPDRFVEANLEFFSRLSDFANDHDVIICMENMPFPDQPIARPADLLGFVNTLGKKNVKICLDTGHCTCLGISAADSVRIIGKDLLKALHIHDNDGISDRHFLPYDGVTDWSAFAKALIDIDYQGVLSLESIVPSNKDKKLQEEKEIDLFNRIRSLDLSIL